MILFLCSVPNASIVIVSSTALFLLILTNWLCSSLIIFPCASAITSETLFNSPGLSGRNTDTVTRINAGHNIHQHLDLIAGLPYEDLESFKQSFQDVYEVRPEQLQLGFLKVLKGSYMEKQKENYGLIYKDTPPYEVLYTKWLPYEDVLVLKKVEEMVEVYYNSSQFSNTLRLLEKEFDTAFALYDTLARFYEEKGYDKVSHSRIARFEILYEFIQTITAEENLVYIKSC